MKRTSHMEEQKLKHYETLFSGWYSPKLISKTYKTYENNMDDILKTERKLRELKICNCCHRFHASTLNELSKVVRTEKDWSDFTAIWNAHPHPHNHFNYIVQLYQDKAK